MLFIFIYEYHLFSESLYIIICSCLGYAAGGSAQGNGHLCPLMHDSVDHWQSSVVVLVLQHDQPSNVLSQAPFGAGGGLPSDTNSLLPPSHSQLPSPVPPRWPSIVSRKWHWVPSILLLIVAPWWVWWKCADSGNPQEFATL